ncbi:hypothetical protein BPNPMPFG_005444 [Mesorhizobium sp. AR07]|uniref:hypothetical protein n=1 Tax=Mesorhizobium sp. AR07 TaxID=2865838 RepID=UPI00215EA21B|nr:hypothetical protein [Mesorhizobium sp. AR07]UVK43632.1 hypothetical protein BPNPMPFG_005444 [Mesorhizobium sp. AR07]
MPKHLTGKTKVLSGYRSVEHQKILFDRAVKKYGCLRGSQICGSSGQEQSPARHGGWTYIPSDTYVRLTLALAAIEPCPFTGKREPYQMVEALMTSDIR